MSPVIDPRPTSPDVHGPGVGAPDRGAPQPARAARRSGPFVRGRSAAVAILIGTAVVATPSVASAQAPAAAATTATIRVAGEGTARVKPDRASIDFGVEATVRRATRTAAARRARSVAASRQARVERALRGAGVPSSAVTTDDAYSHVRVVRVRRGDRRVRQYVATSGLQLRVELSAAAAAKAYDAAVDAGAQGAGGVQFSFSEPDEPELLAQEAALRDARRRADRLAAAQGRTVVDIRSIDAAPEYGDGIGVNDRAESASAASSGSSGSRPTTIRPRPIEVSATVVVVYGLG
ncbi:MAG: SIMPL domain-containing protein [Solirubrobacteraceae bacterium]